MNLQNIGILAGAAVIGYLIYRAAGGGAVPGARQVQSTTGDSINLIYKDGFILDEKGRTWV